jgi:hypothetical protein
MKVPEFIKKIDWSELRNQKTELVKHIDYLRTDYSEANRIEDKIKLADYLEGILNLIDAIQDYAVDDVKIIDAIHVYDFEVEDGEPIKRSDKLEGETDEEYFARINAENIFQMRIEGVSLYMDEEISKEFIESIVDDKEHAAIIKDIIRRNILRDVMNDSNDFMRDSEGCLIYDSTMYDYGFAIEDYCRRRFLKGKTKTVYVCPDCGSEDVEYKTWTNPNTNETNHDHPMEEEDCYCNNCNKNVKLIQKEVPME